MEGIVDVLGSKLSVFVLDSPHRGEDRMSKKLVVGGVVAAAAVVAAFAVFSQLPITADPAKDAEVVSIGKLQGDPAKALQDAREGKFTTPAP